MRDRLIELLEKADETVMGFSIDGDVSVLADHLLANGVIVPPCKVGQIVYEVQPMRARTQGYEITTVKWNGHYWWFTWVVKERSGIYGNVDGFSSHQIGKTVFLTKEEAEKELERRVDNGKRTDN